jgi:hypothetical protein
LDDDDDDIEEGKSPNVKVANALPVFEERREDESHVRIPQVATFVLPPIVLLPMLESPPPPSTRYSLLQSTRLDAARMEHDR